MKLYAICWQDLSEPWGWAPAVDVPELPEGALPDGPFCWTPEEAEAALRDVRERAALDMLPRAREGDRLRRKRELEWYDESGKPRPGVFVNIVGRPQPPPPGPPPEPLKSDAELLEIARGWAEREWSIQIYDVPEQK